eukprot:CAMPEP_0169326572 /NCGR_PEP_ID=MMETSP1017-20121227/11581_1 /TAXON_ID=342587 /ORGANISM="Karlodinium micrum, Strain CCMP2283" /LENGTH=50 /DNA_ID=CAMNT_0009421303 /DNA_START=111 /DNA_END=266 /DNA_ORIENTATION=-
MAMMPTNARGFTWLTVDNDDGGLPGPSQESKAILTQVPFVPEVSQLAEVE